MSILSKLFYKQPPVKDYDPHKDLNVTYVGSAIKHSRVLDSTFFSQITFPDYKHLDEFAQLDLEKTLAEFIERLEKGWFSILDIDGILKLCGVGVHPDVKVTYQQLNHLHCVAFKNIPPSILTQIPSMISSVFTEGRSLTDYVDTTLQLKSEEGAI